MFNFKITNVLVCSFNIDTAQLIVMNRRQKNTMKYTNMGKVIQLEL
jgi:hypothetical protein